MSRGAVLQVAAWEFRRFFKPRDLLLSMALTGILAGAGWGIGKWQASQEPTTREVALIAPFDIALPAHYVVTKRELAQRDTVTADVVGERYDALVVASDGAVEVVARSTGGWADDLGAAAAAGITERRVQALGVDPARLAAALAPPTIRVQSARASGSDSRTLALLLGGLVAVSLLSGLGFLFIGITGEKQQRVTEQVFSMVSAQDMIDGKLLGVGAAALLGAVQYAIVGIAFYNLVGSGGALGWLADNLGQVSLLDSLYLVAFALAGFAFWFATCAAVFATIADPNSSARTSVFMLPLIPFAAAAVGLGNPDSGAMAVLSHVPLTSMAVMPMRVLQTAVPAWEPSVALAVLLAAVWFARRAAGRIFEAAMLTYGKEPGVLQLLRWAAGRG